MARAETAAAIAREGIAVRSMRLGDFSAAPPATAALAAPVHFRRRRDEGDRPRRRARSDRSRAEAGGAVAQRPRSHAGTARQVRLRTSSGRNDPNRIPPGGPLAGSCRAARRCESNWQATIRHCARMCSDLGRRSRTRGFRSKSGRARPRSCGRSSSGCARWHAPRPPRTAISGSSVATRNGERGWWRALRGGHGRGQRGRRADRSRRPDRRDWMLLIRELASLMQRDIAAGREPELDAIAGSVLRAAARHELACPTIARLAGQIAQRSRPPAPKYLPVGAGARPAGWDRRCRPRRVHLRQDLLRAGRGVPRTRRRASGVASSSTRSIAGHSRGGPRAPVATSGHP